MLIAIEGIDGSGKGTLAVGLVSRLTEEGYAARLVSFPQYKATAAGRTIGRLLGATGGEVSLGDLDPYAIACQFAADRDASRGLLAPSFPGEIVVCDRYVASNTAYQGARLPSRRFDDMGRFDDMADFVAQLEFGRNGLPKPDLNILLDLDPADARRLVAKKAGRLYTDMVYDANEADGRLQAEVRTAYRFLASSPSRVHDFGPWAPVPVAPFGMLREPAQILADAMVEVRKVIGPAPAAVCEAAAPALAM